MVLLGSNFNQASVTEVSNALDVLARKSADASPFNNLREVMYFHVTTDKILEKTFNKYVDSINVMNIMNQVINASNTNTKTDTDTGTNKEDVVEGVAVDSKAVETMLSNHHKKSISSTTLYVMYKIFGSNDYYPSTSSPACPQRAFLSTEDFAWIDLSVDAINVESQDDLEVSTSI